MKEKWKALAGKYKYAILLLAVGIVLMLLPTSGKKTAREPQQETVSFSLEDVERRMEQAIGSMEGVGRVRVMLTLKSGAVLELASDSGDSLRDTEQKTDRRIVKLNRGSGAQDVVVTGCLYPTYRGAVVVCEGAGSSTVRLAVTQAVSVLTGLPSDRITVVKWKSS